MTEDFPIEYTNQGQKKKNNSKVHPTVQATLLKQRKWFLW